MSLSSGFTPYDDGDIPKDIVSNARKIFDSPALPAVFGNFDTFYSSLRDSRVEQRRREPDSMQRLRGYRGEGACSGSGVRPEWRKNNNVGRYEGAEVDGHSDGDVFSTSSKGCSMQLLVESDSTAAKDEKLIHESGPLLHGTGSRDAGDLFSTGNEENMMQIEADSKVFRDCAELTPSQIGDHGRAGDGTLISAETKMSPLTVKTDRKVGMPPSFVANESKAESLPNGADTEAAGDVFVVASEVKLETLREDDVKAAGDIIFMRSEAQTKSDSETVDECVSVAREVGSMGSAQCDRNLFLDSEVSLMPLQTASHRKVSGVEAESDPPQIEDNSKDGDGTLMTTETELLPFAMEADRKANPNESNLEISPIDAESEADKDVFIVASKARFEKTNEDNAKAAEVIFMPNEAKMKFDSATVDKHISVPTEVSSEQSLSLSMESDGDVIKEGIFVSAKDSRTPTAKASRSNEADGVSPTSSITSESRDLSPSHSRLVDAFTKISIGMLDTNNKNQSVPQREACMSPTVTQCPHHTESSIDEAITQSEQTPGHPTATTSQAEAYTSPVLTPSPITSKQSHPEQSRVCAENGDEAILNSFSLVQTHGHFLESAGSSKSIELILQDKSHCLPALTTPRILFQQSYEEEPINCHERIHDIGCDSLYPNQHSEHLQPTALSKSPEELMPQEQTSDLSNTTSLPRQSCHIGPTGYVDHTQDSVHDSSPFDEGHDDLKPKNLFKSLDSRIKPTPASWKRKSQRGAKKAPWPKRQKRETLIKLGIIPAKKWGSGIQLYNGRSVERISNVKKCDDKFCQWQPDIHLSRAACERCWTLASRVEREEFIANGRHLRIAMVKGGCASSCKLFPHIVAASAKSNDGAGSREEVVRLCRRCFNDLHRVGIRSKIGRG